MIALYPRYGEPVEFDLDADMFDAMKTEASSGFAYLEALVKQLKRQADPTQTTPGVRLKRDGTPDRRSLVTQRPRQHTVKREAMGVQGPHVESHKRNAVGHYKIWLCCGHTVKRAATNGDNPPQMGKSYACPECSQRA